MKSTLRMLPGPLGTERLSRVLWAAALVTIPVTSFRYYPLVGETTYVRPLSFYPLILLLPLLVLQWLRHDRRVPAPGTVILLALVLLSVMASSFMGALLDPIPLRGQAYDGRVLRAWATLLIGVLFFLSAAAMTQESRDLIASVRWLLVGFGVTLLWSALQAVTFYTPFLEKQMVTHWQLAFSVRELVRTNRISGLAYEPAWLAAQISTIYAPILLGAVLTGVRITRHRWLEPVLLGLAYLLVLATYSRGGILIAFGSALLGLLLVGRDAFRRASKWFGGGFRRGTAEAVLRILLLTTVLVTVLGMFEFLSQKNYFRRLWEISADSLGEYIIDVNAGARTAYAAGAMQAYLDHPLTGVGLGASGLYIYENLPDWSLTTVTEIARQLSPASQLYPNPKNMYVRFLAEAGLPGLIALVLFLFSVLADALSGLREHGAWRLLAVAGVLAWLAIVLQNITQDSLASPNIWLLPGMLAGSASRDKAAVA